MLIIVWREQSKNGAMIQGTVERDYGHEVSCWKTWMTKQKILEQLFDTYGESF
jgi:hypothetical protein